MNYSIMRKKVVPYRKKASHRDKRRDKIYCNIELFHESERAQKNVGKLNDLERSSSRESEVN